MIDLANVELLQGESETVNTEKKQRAKASPFLAISCEVVLGVPEML